MTNRYWKKIKQGLAENGVTRLMTGTVLFLAGTVGYQVNQIRWQNKTAKMQKEWQAQKVDLWNEARKSTDFRFYDIHPSGLPNAVLDSVDAQKFVNRRANPWQSLRPEEMTAEVLNRSDSLKDASGKKKLADMPEAAWQKRFKILNHKLVECYEKGRSEDLIKTTDEFLKYARVRLYNLSGRGRGAYVSYLKMPDRQLETEFKASLNIVTSKLKVGFYSKKEDATADVHRVYFMDALIKYRAAAGLMNTVLDSCDTAYRESVQKDSLTFERHKKTVKDSLVNEVLKPKPVKMPRFVPQRFNPRQFAGRGND